MGYFIIKAKLPSLNEYVRACRANKYQGAKFKADVEELIGWAIKQAQASGKLSNMGEKPCKVYIDWHEKTKRRDVDNIQSAQKYILDALQKCGIIKNDSRKYVKQIYHTVNDSTEDYVVVRLEECETE
jgi:Holliday junction resolvase RusA-like endonuclease